MFHKRTFALSGSYGLLLVLSIFQAIATPLLQSEKPDPAEGSAGAERLPIRLLKRSFETKPSYTEQARLAAVEGTVVVYAEKRRMVPLKTCEYLEASDSVSMKKQ